MHIARDCSSNMTRFMLLLFGCCCCYRLCEPEWNLLKVTWGGFDCLSSTGYFDMPRTEAGAKLAGFEMLSDCGNNGDPNPHWTGKRYAKNDDHDIVLIYDVNGFIAGIQSGISANEFPPAPHINHPFVKYKDKFYITFYTVLPETICNKGRSPDMFSKTGTGTHLFIQNGSSPSEVEEISRMESDLQETQWVKTSRQPTMANMRRKKLAISLYVCSHVHIYINLEHLCEADVLHGDGTFYTSSKLFLQIYTLHAEIQELMHPLVYCLLPNKTESHKTSQHYRLLIKKDIDCDFMSPVFVAYDVGKLSVFGWMILADVNSTYFEHLPLSLTKNTRGCMFDYNGLMTSLHIYMIDPCYLGVN